MPVTAPSKTLRPTTIAEVIEEVIFLVGNKENWIRGTYADVRLRDTPSGLRRVPCWCVEGAVRAIALFDNSLLNSTSAYLRDFLWEWTDGRTRSVIDWQDQVRRTHHEVIDFLVEAHAAAVEEGI